jgi:HD-GYP domain-containing protein (c-di-GMP phosphodiesterase class II)
LKYYVRVPLFCEVSPSVFTLYKSAGEPIPEDRLAEGLHPRLYLQRKDRLEAIQEAQRGFRREISRSIETGDVAGVKDTLCHLVSETLHEPRAGTLQTLPDTVDILVSGYSKHPAIMRTFATISNKDYTTVIHSVNVMALTLNYCFHEGISIAEAKRLGLGALLHDVGKTEIPSDILQAPRKLTPSEFEVMKSHPAIGEKLLRAISRLGRDIAQAALEHHEKLDGSGYPHGLNRISFGGQLVGLVDCYEALTNEDRPYRHAMNPMETLKLIQEDVRSGKFDRALFEKFCYSLT